MNTTCGKMVDLGLPSGLLWAKCNIGAKTEEEFGEYFAWGETKTKSDFTIETYSRWNIAEHIRNHTNYRLPMHLDTATIQMGAGWRMPTRRDVLELLMHTTQCDAIVHGVRGTKFISDKDETKYIFIPYAGYMTGSFNSLNGTIALLWTNTCDGIQRIYNGNSRFCPLAFGILSDGSLDSCGRVEKHYPYYGFSVRAVHD